MVETRSDDKRPTCPRCGNRLRVLADQMGTTVRCPKCNATFVVGGAPPPSALSDVVAGGATPENDDAYQPMIPLVNHMLVPEEPLPELNPANYRDVEYDADWSKVDDIAVDLPPPTVRPLQQEFEQEARRRKMIREYYVPDPPRWTFFSGVLGYPWRGVNLTRWTAMAFGLGVAALLAHAALQWLGFLSGGGNPIAGVLMAMFAILLGLCTLSFATVSCQAAIQDTADGHDAPQDTTLESWVITLLSWLGLAGACGALGYPIALAGVGPLAIVVSVLILFPILLLSALECGSYILPFSPPVLRTLGSYWHGWLMFYLLTTLMLVAWITTFDVVYPQARYPTVFLSGAVWATMMLIYARLLGRVAWKASGATAAPIEIDQDADDAALLRAKSSRGSKNRRKRSSVKIEIPDEIEQIEPPPKINFHLRP